jgi:hypothetical protein
VSQYERPTTGGTLALLARTTPCPHTLALQQIYAATAHLLDGRIEDSGRVLAEVVEDDVLAAYAAAMCDLVVLLSPRAPAEFARSIAQTYASVGVNCPLCLSE